MAMRENLARFLRGQKNIKIAYLFGSVARGEPGPLSDIDIAVYMDEKLSKIERSKRKLLLIYEISGILNTDKFDLVVMNDTPSCFNYEIIKRGDILVADEETRMDLETRILSEYLDRRYYDKMHMESFLERVSQRGLS